MIKKQHFHIPGGKGRSMLMDITFNDALKNAPIVIFVHGFKGFKDWGTHNLVAKLFAENGFKFLKFNFSHNGTTSDNPLDFTDLIAFSDNTFSIELDDLNAIIDFACGGSAMPSATGVYLIGHSMGGGISIIKTAGDQRIKKLVTMASISGFRDLWPKEIEDQWRLTGIIYMPNKRTGQQMPLKVSLLNDLNKYPAGLDIIAKATEIKQPWLIVHGDDDTSVPLSHAQELKAAQPNAELFIVQGGDHVFGATHPFIENALPVPLLEYCIRAISFLNN